ncbi:hypothetical protein KEJ45_00985 [Candidatus Bathyarchaeota archaeon]|nr:hypothetical protein [Candidatus Bathyarchaeota archaeon]
MKVKIPRNVKITTHPFTKFFKDFENVDAVKQIFGEKTKEVLSNLQVEFAGFRGYMGVSDIDGHMIISAYYLNNGDLTDIYLDIIHELVHVKQFMEGKELFDDRYSYVGRPTEIEAYRHAVEEARRLGFDDARICQYLKTEWMSERELKKLVKALNVEYVPPDKR